MIESPWFELIVLPNLESTSFQLSPPSTERRSDDGDWMNIAPPADITKGCMFNLNLGNESATWIAPVPSSRNNRML